MSMDKKIKSYKELIFKADKVKKDILHEIKSKVSKEVYEKIKKYEKEYKLKDIKIDDDEIILEYLDCYEELPKFVKINRMDVKL